MTDTAVLTRERATQIVAEVERVFGAADVDAILAGFTDDVVVRFGDFSEMRGRAAVEDFVRARFRRMRGYRLTKTLLALDGDRIANTWVGEWEDVQTGRRMRGHGVEVWQMAGERIAVWEAAFNVWPDGGGPATPIV